MTEEILIEEVVDEKKEVYVHKTPSYIRKANKNWYIKKREEDPEYVEKIRQKNRDYYNKKKNDPEFMEKQRIKKREIYKNKKENAE
jgi:hypothetical protein